MKESSDKGQENRDAHLMQVEMLLKGQPFWKIALFGVLCAERQWPVYERLCVGREWGNAKGMRKVMERDFGQCIRQLVMPFRVEKLSGNYL